MSSLSHEQVTSAQHWTDTLFSFKTTRDPGVQLSQFAMIGLDVNDRPLLRAYSMASANHEEHLEFFSIKVKNGPLTSPSPAPQARQQRYREQQADGHADT